MLRPSRPPSPPPFSIVAQQETGQDRPRHAHSSVEDDVPMAHGHSPSESRATVLREEGNKQKELGVTGNHHPVIKAPCFFVDRWGFSKDIRSEIRTSE